MVRFLAARRRRGAAQPRSAHRRAVLALAVTLAGTVGPTTDGGAQARVTRVVSNDPGGQIVARLREIEQIVANNERVEIRGEYCHSTCTMLIGLDQTCISARTRFGFHGPSFMGVKMSDAQFEYWSRQMAQFYPETLKDWYMRVGRTRISGLYEISGSELIRMGIRECSDGGLAHS